MTRLRSPQEIAARIARFQALTLPKLPSPGEPFDGGVIIASCWGNDDVQDDGTPPFAEILLLMPTPPFYRLTQIEVEDANGTWVITVGTDTRHPNIIPAAEDYSNRIGGY